MRSEKVRRNGCLNEDLKSYSELCLGLGAAQLFNWVAD